MENEKVIYYNDFAQKKKMKSVFFREGNLYRRKMPAPALNRGRESIYLDNF